MMIMEQNMRGMMRNGPIMMRGMSQAMLPMFRRQHVQMLSDMSKMNPMALAMTWSLHEQNAAMAEKLFEMSLDMTSAESDDDEEAEA